MKIVVLGGTGLLGSELKQLDSELICVGRNVDIRNYDELSNFLNKTNPNIIVNCAAETNSVHIGKNPLNAINVNIIGAANVAKYCLLNNVRLIYISTDYVYEGKGDHRESDPLNPNNDYAWTKLGGECSSKLVINHCIIRTSFGHTKFPYDTAYKNVISSKDYVDRIAPKILKIIKSKFIGIINVGSPERSIYNYALERNNNVAPDYLDTQKEQNFSLNLKKYNELFENR